MSFTNSYVISEYQGNISIRLITKTGPKLIAHGSAEGSHELINAIRKWLIINPNWVYEQRDHQKQEAAKMRGHILDLILAKKFKEATQLTKFGHLYQKTIPLNAFNRLKDKAFGRPPRDGDFYAVHIDNDGDMSIILAGDIDPNN